MGRTQNMPAASGFHQGTTTHDEKAFSMSKDPQEKFSSEERAKP